MNRRPQAAGAWLRPLGLALVIVGYFGPWVPHKTAALTVTGHELSQFAKFFPQVRGGAVHVVRALFLTPLIVAAVSIGLWAHAHAKRLLTRLIVIAFGLLLTLFALPPYNDILAPPYRLRLILAAAASLLVLLAPLSRRLPRRARGALMGILALVGAIPALWQFALLRPLVAALYDAPIGLGWGLILCVAGFALLLISAAFDVRQRSATDRAPTRRHR